MICHSIDMAAVGPVEIASELQIVGRICKDQIDAGIGQRPHRSDAVAGQNLP